jgi:probable rRNA maturation factor
VPAEVRCSSRRGRAFARALAADAARLARAAGLGRAELSLMLVGDSAMRALNRRWRGIDRATDVLAFSQLEERGAPPVNSHAAARLDGRALGDVVISVDTAVRQARELGVAPAARLRTLLIHGFLHLIGYDHERSAADARRMFARERALALKLGARAAGGKARRRR